MTRETKVTVVTPEGCSVSLVEKQAELVAIFLLKGDLTDEEIFDLVWGAASTKGKARGSLHQTRTQIKKKLGDLVTIKFHSHKYHLVEGYTVEVDEWGRLSRFLND